MPLALNGTGSANLTIYARVFGGQGAVPPGTYGTSFSASDTDFVYGTALGILPCPNVVALPQHAHPTFTGSASVLGNCLVSAADIGFGSQGFTVGGSGNVPVFGTSFSEIMAGVSRSFTSPIPNVIIMNMGSNDGSASGSKIGGGCRG